MGGACATKWLGWSIFAALFGIPLLIYLLEDARWPELDQVEPIQVSPAQLPGDEPAWALLAEASLTMSDRRGAREALRGEGPPEEADREAWKEHGAALEALQQALARPGLSPPRSADLWAEPDPAIFSLRPLARYALLRGWDRALAGEPVAGVEDMSGAILTPLEGKP